jgi:aspartate aminotransferase
VTLRLSGFAQSLEAETAFTVLAIAKSLQAAGKDVVELEIGDSPFPSPEVARTAGIAAIQDNQTRYGPSPGTEALRAAAARYVRESFDIPAETDNVLVGPGAKVFQQFFCEAFLEPGDGVLVFSPHFPTYVPNIRRRGAREVLTPLRQEREFRPDPAAVERFLSEDPAPRAIFLNSPHNPTGGVATREDLVAIADLLRSTGVAFFSDEPYCHMVWEGRHRSLMAEDGMLDQGVTAFTFSKAYSMGGWRLGFSVAAAQVTEAMASMVNTTVSCVPPFVQAAGVAALTGAAEERDAVMSRFREKVRLLADGLNRLGGIHTLEPHATFYVFPNVAPICNRLGITSHGLALYLLEGADDDFGVACLGGECFGPAGEGFLRFSCAASDERLLEAVAFIGRAVERTDRLQAFLEERPAFALREPYPTPTGP